MYGLKGAWRFFGLCLGLLLLITFYTVREQFLVILIMTILSVFVLRLLGKREPTSSLDDIGKLVIPLFYIPVLLNFQLLLREAGPEWIIFLYGTVWASDSLAFYIGKTFGKRRLFKEVSPNKTVAGAVGSLSGGIITTYIFSQFLIPMTPGRVITTGIIIGLSAVIGDLIESMFKRDAGVKDSSNIIPGHGGILDKIDGSLFTGPLLWLVMRI